LVGQILDMWVLNLNAGGGAGVFVVGDGREAVGIPWAASENIPLPRSIYCTTTIIITTTRRGNDYTHNNR
jgi:hypothetical protein